MKIAAADLQRLLGDASRSLLNGFSGFAIDCATAESLLSELIAAREVIAATETLLSRAEVKAAAMMAPALGGDIGRLRQALKDYKAK